MLIQKRTSCTPPWSFSDSSFFVEIVATLVGPTPPLDVFIIFYIFKFRIEEQGFIDLPERDPPFFFFLIFVSKSTLFLKYEFKTKSTFLKKYNIPFPFLNAHACFNCSRQGTCFQFHSSSIKNKHALLG